MKGLKSWCLDYINSQLPSLFRAGIGAVASVVMCISDEPGPQHIQVFSIFWFHWSCTDSGRMGLGWTFVYSSNAFCLEKETQALWQVKELMQALNPRLLNPGVSKATWSHHWWFPMAKVCHGQSQGAAEGKSCVNNCKGAVSSPRDSDPSSEVRSPPQNRSSAASKQGNGGKADEDRLIPVITSTEDRVQMSDLSHVSNQRVSSVKGLPPHERTGCAKSVKQSQTAKTWPWAHSDEVKSTCVFLWPDH